MKLGIAVVLAGCLVAGKDSAAQSPTPQPGKPAPQSQPAPQSNPFPEDTNNVPVMSNGDAPAPKNVQRSAAAEAPGADADPVRSPDDPVGNASTDAQGFSSSASGIDNFTPSPDIDADQRRGKKGKAAPAPEHTESAAEDEKVGDYYLDKKNWKAALSRYESAVVLDPENPEVYWGMGEAQRHLGKLAEAKAAYEKLVEYDPDSKHGKEAKKLLKGPELANAPTASAKQP
jgi:tetratricopeptide (TPR) repeat protein